MHRKHLKCAEYMQEIMYICPSALCM